MFSKHKFRSHSLCSCESQSVNRGRDQQRKTMWAELSRKRKFVEVVILATSVNARCKNSSSIPVTVGGRNMKTKTSKRKRLDDGNRHSRNKAATGKDGFATRVRQIYREPKGVRKSDRIAGRPADGRGLPPASQYAWRVEPSGSEPPAGSTSKSSKHQSRNASITDVRSTEQRDRAKDTAREAQMRQQGFLKVLANNVGTHRMLRYMTHDYTTWTHRIAALKNARGGLVELNNQVRRMERNASHSQEDLDNARKRRDHRQDQLDHAKACVDSLTEPLKDLNAKHFDRNNRIYDFIDVSRQSASLQCLPAKFWTTYDDCNAAYTAGKDIELEIHDIEQERLSILRQLDERLENSVLRGSQTSIGGTSMQATQHIPFQEPFENMAERIRELGGTSVRSHQLYESSETARDIQYDRESKLNRIAEDAFVAAGFLEATNDINEVKFHRRLQTARGAQGPRSERMSDFSGSIEGQLRSARQTPFKARLAARVRQARKNVKSHRRRLDDIRWRQLSNAGSIDSDAKGQLRVRKMIERTCEFREAEDEYRSILHRAKDDHAISESDQSSNFRDRESDGYGASALKSMGYPLAEKRKNCVREWMSGGCDVGWLSKLGKMRKLPTKRAAGSAVWTAWRLVKIPKQETLTNGRTASSLGIKSASVCAKKGRSRKQRMPSTRGTGTQSRA